MGEYDHDTCVHLSPSSVDSLCMYLNSLLHELQQLHTVCGLRANQHSNGLAELIILCGVVDNVHRMSPTHTGLTFCCSDMITSLSDSAVAFMDCKLDANSEAL